MNRATFGNSTIVEVPVAVSEASRLSRVSNHHILIFDRSGSMYSHIKGLVEDLKEFLTTRMGPDDMVSVGWFSTEGGQCDFVLKCCDVSRAESIKKALDKIASTVGMTCFSEILGMVPGVIDTGVSFCDTASLMFFSDGYPVVRNLESEMGKVRKALSEIAPKIGNAVVVGYGQFYNRATLAEMSELLGATFVHASRLTDFYAYLDSGYVVSGGSKKVYVAVPAGAVSAFCLDKSTKSIIRAQLDPVDSSVRVPDTVSKVYAVYATENVPGTKVGAIDVAAAYALSALLIGDESVFPAVEVLSSVGDVRLVDLAANAWTIDDFARAHSAINSAVFDPVKRFTGGKKVGCLPDRDAFCVLDALDVLSNDNDAYLDLNSFEYKRIGAPRKAKDGYPKFVRTDELVPLRNIVFASDRMNVSISVSIGGTIDIGTNDLGLPRNYPCYQWRNFTIVRDGALNVDLAKCSMSLESFDALVAGGLIDEKEVWAEGNLYEINFSNVPMVSLKYISDLSAERVARMRGKELALTARQKVVGYYLSKLEQDAGLEEGEGELTPEQQAYLNSLGVKKGIYSPPTLPGEVTDEYLTRTFEIVVKGWSSLPKVEDVLQKVNDGKKLTGPSVQIAAYLEKYRQVLSNYGSDEDKFAYLLDERDDIRQTLRTLRRELQGLKFSVCLMPGVWFEGISISDPVIEVDGVEYTFKIGSKNVEY